MSTEVVPVPVVGRRSINAYLLLGERPVLVDTGIPGSAPRIRDALDRRSIAPRDVSLIVLTHGHVDHFGSAADLRDLTGAPVAGHVGDAERYRSGEVPGPLRPTGLLGRVLARTGVPRRPARPVPCDIVWDGEARLDEHGVAARVVPSPGHTPGSLAVLTDAGDLVAGDVVAGALFGLLPRRPANPPFHDDADLNLASLRALLALGPRAVHVGHGGPLDPDRVARWAEREERRLRRR